MSALQQTQDVTAEKIEARASYWLGRREFGNLNEQDQKEFETWLEASTAHRVAFVRLESSWNRTVRLAALRTPNVEQKAERGKRSRPLTYIAALSVVSLAFVAALSVYMLRPAETVYATAIGGHKTVTLEDGTIVELNTDTLLRARISSQSRIVQLDRGEAFFHVRHEAARPFVVTAVGDRVIDLGTQFVVRNDLGRLKVSLIEGRARFEATGAPKQILAPGDVVIANGKIISLTKMSTKDLTSDCSWRRGLLTFRHTALGEAAAEFNRYNDKKLVIADSSVARLQIRGTFRTGDVGVFANVARDVLGLHVVSRGGDIVVTR